MVTITPSPTDRDIRRLKGVHPALAAAIKAILVDMQAAGHQMFVVMGVRTLAEQQAIYAHGRTVPGAIVTNKDGVQHPSNHQPKADGYGYAVDCAFLGTRDPFALELPWQLYGAKVEAHGLTWGGRWTHPHDSPHAELPFPAAGTTPALRDSLIGTLQGLPPPARAGLPTAASDTSVRDLYTRATCSATA